MTDVSKLLRNADMRTSLDTTSLGQLDLIVPTPSCPASFQIGRTTIALALHAFKNEL